MKASAILVAALAQVGSAHYFMDAIVQNGTPGPSWKYIREFTRKTAYNPIKYSINPKADIRDDSFIDGPDARCNQGAFTNAGKTQVLEVVAGTSVTANIAVGASAGHPGPALYYLSRAPGDNVKAYDGSGDWFKIGQEGVCDKNLDFTNKAWCTFDKKQLTATIPKNTPNGEYLLRMEHIGVHRSHVNQPEHFVSCVQIKVTGGGNGTPGPMVKFPGAYKATDPYANFSIYNGYKPFTFPGPEVWNGSSSAAAPPPAVVVTPPATTLVRATSTSAAPTAAPTAAPPANAPACAVKFAQCGGLDYSGPTCCQAGSTCRRGSRFMSQCL